MNSNFRIGNGIDVHQFSEGRKLIIGGIEIPFEKGLLGHSDADVLLHSICDALLGALSLGDIGQHFPDTDEKYKNIDSKILLKEVYQLIKNNGYKLINCDNTLLLQKPKISPYIFEMRKIISELLETSIDNISIKATTMEGLGFIGNMEGAASFSTILLTKSEN